QVLTCDQIGTLGGSGNFRFDQGATFTAVVTAQASAVNCATLNNTASVQAANADQVTDTGQINCKGVPALTTTPNPSAGAMGPTRVGDSATLSNGIAPTGTITFRLYPPSDPSCAGAASFTNVVNVNGNGNYSTSANYGQGNVNQVGTWHWKASYSG